MERVGFEKALTLDGMHGILCGLRQVSRAVAQCTFVEAWAGFRPDTPDHLPIMGLGSLTGFYAATGHFRHGILLAPATARLMTELILHGRSSFDLAPFAPSRFRR